MKKSLLLTFATLTAAAQERPNVVFILADDLGYGDLSCYGGEEMTPHVDSLAACGVRFSNAHAVASTSTPSRYGILTGCYPFRRQGTDVAAGNAGMIIKPEQTTVADVFHAAGYRTAALGKWHLGLGAKTAEQDWNGKLDQSPEDLGFDYHYIMAATADRVPCVFIEQGKVANFDENAPIEVSYQQPFEGEPTAKNHPELCTVQRSSHGHDQAIVNGIGRIGFMKGGGRALWRDEDISDSIIAHFVDFLDKNPKNTPFFVYLCTNDVHVPRQPHERFRGKSKMGLRGEAILQFDWTVGKVREALEKKNLLDNTLIIITSDNGPVLDDGYDDRAEELVGTHRIAGPFRGGKYSAFEAGNAVPLIVAGAGVKKRESDALVSHIDILASMAALAGQPVPAGTDSRDALKTWLGKSQKSADFHISMASNRSLEIRTEKWKYIEPSNGGPLITWGPKIETGYSRQPQLYNLKKDVGEKENVAEKYPRKVKELKHLLTQIINF